jgi:penicillin-binding protein 1A
MRRRPVAVAMALALAGSACSLTPIDLESERRLPLRSTIVAADGTLLARLFKENRAYISLEEMPPTLTDAVLAAEDARFFEHEGYDLKSIVRAAVVNLREGEVQQGGSTITQQYVKNTYFRHPGKTIERKAKELRLSIEVERRYSKEEILERYLNTVYLGAGAYGVKAAAENLFGHGVGTLSLAESALLAAVIKAPALYDPRDHPKRARERRDYVVDRMEELALIDPVAAESARREPLGVVPQPEPFGTRQPYFVEAVKRQVLTDKRFGPTEVDRARELYRGGMRITSTIDLELQAMAERAVRNVLDEPGDPAAALIAIEPSTGHVVAMVGGRNWSESQVNLALGRAGGGSGRQPGSSFKPIALAAAMEQGITLDQRYEAGPGFFTFEDGSSWSPRNSEGTASGSLPLDEALVRSVNGVYARLALDIGGGQIATQAELMGVKAKLSAFPSIALGSEEVSVLDMAAAYATIANHGTAIEPTTVESVNLDNGAAIEPDQKVVPSALSPTNAFLLTKAMEQVIIRGTGRAASIGRPAAGKTGTTNDYADAWFVGFTPQLVTAVWVGYPEGRRPMTNVHGLRVAGGTFPAIIWRNFMLAAHQGLPVKRFRLPASEYVYVEIDPVTGLRAAPWCPGEKVRMLRQLVPLEFCPPPVFETPTPIDASPTPSPDKKKGKDEPSPSPSPSPKDKPSPTASPSPRGTPSPSP